MLFHHHSHHHHANQYAYDQVYGEPYQQHQAKLSHELMGGAAAFAAMKAYEDHCARNGRPGNHVLAKEVLAGLVGFEIDRLAETKGMDMWSKHEARKHAEMQAYSMYDSMYNPGAYQMGNIPSYAGYGGPPEGFMPYGGGGYGGGGYGGGGYGGGGYGYGQGFGGPPAYGGPPGNYY